MGELTRVCAECGETFTRLHNHPALQLPFPLGETGRMNGCHPLWNLLGSNHTLPGVEGAQFAHGEKLKPFDEWWISRDRLSIGLPSQSESEAA